MKKLFKKLSVVMMALVAAVAIAGVAPAQAEAAAKAPTKITMNKKSVTLAIGKTYTLKVKSVKPKNASKSVKYKSSNTKVVSVSSKGILTAKKVGTAKITVSSKVKSSRKTTVTVKVVYPATTSLKLNRTSATLTTKSSNQYVNLSATVKPTKAAPVYWTSSNKNIATVGTTGKTAKVTVKPYAAGTVTITAKSGTKSVKCTIKVNKSYKDVSYTSGKYVLSTAADKYMIQTTKGTMTLNENDMDFLFGTRTINMYSATDVKNKFEKTNFNIGQGTVKFQKNGKTLTIGTDDVNMTYYLKKVEATSTSYKITLSQKSDGTGNNTVIAMANGTITFKLHGVNYTVKKVSSTSIQLTRNDGTKAATVTVSKSSSAYTIAMDSATKAEYVKKVQQYR